MLSLYSSTTATVQNRLFDAVLGVQTMSQLIILRFLCSVGFVIVVLFGLMFVVGKVTFSRTTLLTTAKNSENSRQPFSHPDMMLYTMNSEANLYSSNQEIVDYIRSHISQPSLTRPRQLKKPNKTDASQVGQSALVDKLLSGRRNGFFIECGAADGETYSNSLFFELERNWTGILIEANPLNHRALLKKNRRAYVLHACLSTTGRPTTANMQLRGLLSRIAKRGRKINCFPVDAILESLKVNHVDYFSLDVEGAELEILRTIAWTKFRIDVLSVEYRINGIGRINKKATLTKLKHLRDLFRQVGEYREVTVLPRVNESLSLDVVFSRI